MSGSASMRHATDRLRYVRGPEGLRFGLAQELAR